MYDLIIDGFVIMNKETSTTVLSSHKALSLAFIGLTYEVRDETNKVLMRGTIKNKGLR